MEKILGVLIFIGILVLIAILVASPLMLLWNWLMPEIFGLPEVDFWQALGLFLLTSFLFKDVGSNNKK